MKNLSPGIYLTDGIKTTALSSVVGWSSGKDEDADAASLVANVAYLYACYSLRSDKLSGLPREIVRTGGGGQVMTEKELPFSASLTDLLWRTEWSLNLYGAAYWLKERNTVRLKGVRWLDPSTMTPKVNETQGLYKFERQLSTTKKNYPVNDWRAPDLVYFWLPGIQEVAPGVAMSTVMRRAGEVLKSIDMFSDRFFDQGAMPITLLVVPANTRPEEIERLEGRLSRVMHGVRNAFKPIGVRANVEVKPLGSPPADLALPELTQAKRDEILAVTGVPISLVTGTSVNFATAQQEARNFIENKIQPRADLLQRILNQQLFNALGLEFRFKIEQLPVMRQDEIRASAALLNMVNAGVPLEAALAMAGYNLEEIPANLAAMIRAAVPALPQPNSNGTGRQPKPPPVLANDGTAKADDLRRWRRKARKAAKSGTATVPFESDVIEEAEAVALRAALEYAGAPEEVDAIFSAEFFRGAAAGLYQGYP